MKRIITILMAVWLVATAVVPGNSAFTAGQAAVKTPANAAAASIAEPVPPEEIPQRLPQTLGNMTMNKLFYKPKQHTGTIDCVDLSAVWGSARIAALCLQGLAARNSEASIFFITCASDTAWKDYLAAAYGTEFRELSLSGMFEKYAPFVKNLVVYDWDAGNGDPYQMVMAVNMAAVSDGLPVTKDLAARMTGEWGYPGTIGEEDITARWGDKLETYEWGIQNVLPLCNKNYAGACDANDTIWDYLYATKSFSFWLDYKVKEEKDLIDDILAADGYTMPGVVLGYGPHGDELLHATGPKGFGYLVSDFFVNATFLASYPSTDTAYRQNPIDTGMKGENGVMYVSVYISDGDNIQFNQKASQGMWTNTTDRGKYPVALELNPALQELAPPMLEWFESRRTNNDELMGGPAGFSYIWEDEFKADTETWNHWQAINNYFLNKADMRVIASSRVTNSNFLNRFMQKSAVLGALDWGDPYDVLLSFSGKPYIYGGKPVIVSANCGRDIADKFNGIRPNPFGPSFFSLCVTQGEVCSEGNENAYKLINSELDKLKTRYGSKIQFVLPSDLLTMAKNYTDSPKDIQYLLKRLVELVQIIPKLIGVVS